MSERVVKVVMKGDASDLVRSYTVAEGAGDHLGREVDKLDRKIRDTFKSGPVLPVQPVVEPDKVPEKLPVKPGRAPKLPVTPEVDPDKIPEKLPRRSRTPKLPVDPEVDPGKLPKKLPIPRDKVPKVPVEMDPLMADFQARLRRETAALARQINAEIPVTPQTDRLREQLKTRLVEIEKNLKMEVPTEPEGRREYELALRAMVDSAARHVEAHVETKVDHDVLGTTMAQAGQTASKGFAGSFMESFSGLGVEMGPVLIGAAIGAAPFVASTMSGAILAGLGAGVLGGGIALAFRDEQVQAAATELGHNLLSDLSAAASVFVTPLRDGLAYLQATSRSIMPEIRKDFELLAPFVGKLVTGLSSLVTEMMPGLSAGLKGAQPMLDTLANALPEIGAAIGDFFEIITRDGDRTASNFEAFLAGLAGAIRGAGYLIHGLTVAWNNFVEGILLSTVLIAMQAEKAFGWIPGLGAKLHEFLNISNRALADYENGATGATDATKGYAGAIKESSGPMEAAKARSDALNTSLEKQIHDGKTLTDIWRLLNGGLADADQAMLRASEQLKVITDGFNEHGRALTGNSDAALKNRIALTDYLVIANQIYDANIAAGKSTDEAAAAMNAYTERLRQTMRQAGFTDAQINAFIDTVSRVPTEKSVAIRVDADSAQFTVERIRNTIDQIQDREITITAHMQQRDPIDHRNATPNRWGGVYQPAAVGYLREAATYSATNPGRYMIAEPPTGGEAFVPKFGNPARSIGILQQAAGWYGMTVGRAGGGGGETFVGTAVLEVDGEVLYNSQLRFERNSGKR